MPAGQRPSGWVNGIVLVAAERLPELLAVHPRAVAEPAIEAPPSRVRGWARDAAITEIVRGRMTLIGPTTAQALADSLAIDVTDADAALLALESEGVVLRGRFAPHLAPRTWHFARRTSHVALRPSGVTARSSPGSTAIPSTGCARRSSQSARRTSCASCSSGSTWIRPID